MVARESAEDRRETYRSLAVIGWVILLFDALLAFFLPAGWRLGQRWFMPLVITVAVVGLALAVTGHILNYRSRRS